MQKKLIALAVAGLASSAAFAQSNVTVYGVADVYVGTGTASGNTRVNSVGSSGLSGSRIGFKGTEDLGNGLKALFTLEYGIAPDTNSGIGNNTGSNSTVARQQFVGLTGGFGTAVAGRLQTTGYDFSALSNPLHGSILNPLNKVQANFAAGAALNSVGAGYSLIGQSSRASNAIAYISPSFSGFTVAVNHARLSESASNSTTAPAASSDSVASLYSVTYNNGPLAASFTTANAALVNNSTLAAVNGTAVYNAGAGGVAHLSENALGASYDFGVVKLYGSYQTHKIDGLDTDKAWQLSGLIPVTAAGKVVVEYAKNTIASDKKANGTNPNNDSNVWTLAYLHSLSKRTTVYAGYMHTSNDSDVLGGAKLGGLQAPISTPALNGGGSSNSYVLGVNHAF